MKTYILVTAVKDHLGQTKKYEKAVSENYLEQAIENAKIEGRTIVSVKERKEST